MEDQGGRLIWAPILPAAQVLPTDELAEPKKAHRQSHRKKVLPEIYLTRLLSTKVGLGLVSAAVEAQEDPVSKNSKKIKTKES